MSRLGTASRTDLSRAFAEEERTRFGVSYGPNAEKRDDDDLFGSRYARQSKRRPHARGRRDIYTNAKKTDLDVHIIIAFNNKVVVVNS